MPAEPAPLAIAAHAVGERWTLLLVDALLAGPQRFSDLQAAVPGIAPNILTRRLTALEGHGIVVASPYSERPRRYRYELTATGRELAGALRLLAHWAGDEAEAIRHAACGTPAEPRWYCPTCDRTVADIDLGEPRWV
jgi:DNA-binding HxlR family transcriptional regulator